VESKTPLDEAAKAPGFWTGDLSGDPALREELLRSVPDRPRYVRARGLMLSGRCRVVLGPEGRRGAGFFVGDPERHGICQAIHRPVTGLVSGLFDECSTCSRILTDPENAEHFASLLGDWEPRPATVHVHPAPGSIPLLDGDVRLLSPEDFADPGAARVRAVFAAFGGEELQDLEFAAARMPTAAVWRGEQIVSYCWASHETETWWDLEGATAAAYRRQGFGRVAGAFLIAHMLERGKRPVWGALDANDASRRMAVASGFRAVDRMVLLTAPAGLRRPGGCA